MYRLARALLFKLPPETAHKITLKLLDTGARLGISGDLPSLPTEVMGLHFANPVGLAAGLDKNGEAIEGLAALGFGFIEVGTVTPRAQPGNPKPRLFRLPAAGALINRMGFNNEGLDALNTSNVSQINLGVFFEPHLFSCYAYIVIIFDGKRGCGHYIEL